MEADQLRALASALDRHRDELIRAVATTLSASLPMVGVSVREPDRAAVHREQMATTARRFHEMLQAGLTLDWGLVAQEYAWSRRVLSLRGVTWEHQQALLDAYFAAAGTVRALEDAERAALQQVAERVRQTAADAWGVEGAAPGGGDNR
jgi:hypothetical protein